MRIELVIWKDASAHEGWESAEDTHDDDYVITSIGFVFKETENNLTLAMDIAEDGTSNGRGRIPKDMIIKREIIREG